MQENYIPSDDEIRESTGSEWRPTNGKFEKSKSGEPDYQERAMITGVVKSFGVLQATAKDAKEPDIRLRVVVQTRDEGEQPFYVTYIKAGKGYQKFSQAGGLAGILMQVNQGDIIRFKPGLSDKSNKAGGKNTFINGFKIVATADTATGQVVYDAVPIRVEYDPDDQRSPEERLDEAISKLQAHPMWTVYPPRGGHSDDDDGRPAYWDYSAVSQVATIAKARGGCGPDQNPGGYLALFQRVYKSRQFGSIEDVPESCWNDLLTQLVKNPDSALPKELAEYDPFADEPDAPKAEKAF